MPACSANPHESSSLTDERPPNALFREAEVVSSKKGRVIDACAGKGPNLSDWIEVPLERRWQCSYRDALAQTSQSACGIHIALGSRVREQRSNAPLVINSVNGILTCVKKLNLSFC